MPNEEHPAPRNYQGVTISSTFTDLKDHRAALINAIQGQGLTAVAMENDSAKLLDVIDSSLQMVQDGSAYIGVISRKYGQIPKCPNRNPDNVSITELEFNEAQRLGRPILLFIMGDEHPLREKDIEANAAKRKKLKTFRERAKQMKPDSSVHRVYTTFNTLEEFKEKAIHAVAGLRRYFDESAELPTPGPQPTDHLTLDLIPKPPAFYAEPPYIGSHKFVGRQAELERLSDWAEPADPHTVLLFEAIGGAGKSMLTWEWTTKHAAQVRGDWAGLFWYSFYEKGAVMADFCRRALAYITEKPLGDFRKKKTAELGKLLLHQLQARPWLLILDGLERVLVAYHRFDAAQVLDEQVDTSKDQIANRDPRNAIRPEDDDLLRTLSAAAPSKLLITTRLTPRVLLNPSGQGIQGVLRVSLPGLRPLDAEALLRACDVTGTSEDIQKYLQTHCDCHPLVTGVLAGLIAGYLPSRGNFDDWVADQAGGGRLNLANLDLVQKRNHILYTALAALPEKSSQLLSTLALLSESVDYPTLSAFNPHMPPEPEEVEKPERPQDERDWDEMSNEEKEEWQQSYESALQRHNKYEEALIAWRQSPEFRAAPQELAKTIRDLERRGLLQYDAQAKHYDLHPVVRGISAGGLKQDEKEIYGQRVVDHFSQQAHSPYEDAESLEDVRHGLQVFRTLLQMGRYEQACDAYIGDLASALLFNLEAYSEILSLLRPFFPEGWAALPATLDARSASYLVNDAAIALESTGELKEALIAYGAALESDLQRSDWTGLYTHLTNISLTLHKLGSVAKEERCILLDLGLATQIDDQEALFITRSFRFRQLAETGRWSDAEMMWHILDPMGRNWVRARYRPGDLERAYANWRFWQGDLSEVHLLRAEQLAKAAKNRRIIRALHHLRGEWQLQQGNWGLAADSLGEAVRMAREVGQTDASAEAHLALAKFHLHQLPEARYVAEQLAKASWVSDLALADLWLALGDTDQARKHALRAYEWAWADGEPYVWRYELNRARELLQQIGADIPNLLPYDPAKDEKLPWEDEVAAAIEKLRAQNETEKRSKEEKRKAELKRGGQKRSAHQKARQKK